MKKLGQFGLLIKNYWKSIFYTEIVHWGSNFVKGKMKGLRLFSSSNGNLVLKSKIKSSEITLKRKKHFDISIFNALKTIYELIIRYSS